MFEEGAQGRCGCGDDGQADFDHVQGAADLVEGVVVWVGRDVEELVDEDEPDGCDDCDAVD